MTQGILYHDGNRQLQDQFGSRRISDRLEEKLTRTQLTPNDTTFIESVPYFFLATADAEGRPDCSYQGGMPGFVRIVVVPDGRPRTKPKACNVGLTFAKGEFLVIFDAEDRPEPDQLRKAVGLFRANGEQLVCVQGRLNYFNSDENLLTRCFTPSTP